MRKRIEMVPLLTSVCIVGLTWPRAAAVNADAPRAFLGHVALVVEDSASDVMRWFCSNRHILSQPSRFVVLPSSHCSPGSRTPFPHTALIVVVDVVVVVVVVIAPALQVPPPHVKP